MEFPKLFHVYIVEEEKEWQQHFLTLWKPLNPTWDFLFWNSQNIATLLKKYPSLLCLYQLFQKNHYENARDILASYLILKEHGGVYTRTEWKNPISLDAVITSSWEPKEKEKEEEEKPCIFIATTSTSSSMFRVFQAPSNYYLPQLLIGMEPKMFIWKDIFAEIKQKCTSISETIKTKIIPVDFALATTARFVEQQLPNTLVKLNHPLPIIEQKKTNISQRIIPKQKQKQTQKQIQLVEVYMDTNQVISSIANTLWNESSSSSSSSYSFFVPFQQLGLFVLAIVIILVVEKIYAYNSQIFGSVQVLPGVGVVSSTPAGTQKKKKKES